jgi:uncharacterized integral membrane protein
MMTTGEWLRLAVAALTLGALLLFFLQNLHDARISFLWFDWTTRTIWALIASGALGAVGGALATTLFMRRRKPRAPAPQED